MRRFFDYYRQFEELSPEEVSRQFRERRDEEKARALTEKPALDLTSAAWHEPPHAEIVNAATFALRRAVNAYPDAEATAAREAIGALHGVDAARIVAGHGAGELLRAACHALLGASAGAHDAGVAASAGAHDAGGGHDAPLRAGHDAGEVAIAWPGWGPLPRLVHEAGGRPVPVPLDRDGAADVDALLAAAGDHTRAVALATPNDPTGATVGADAVRRLAAGLPEHSWILLDAALADFGEEDLVPLVADAPRLLVFRSFSKAHGMAGFRAGYAAGTPQLLARLAPVSGASAPAQAGMAWAAANGERYLPRRRALAAAQRERLAAAVATTPVAFPRGTGPLVWLSSAEHTGAELAAHLASRRIFVTPGTAWGDDRHVRAALRGNDATDRLAAALAELAG